MADSYNGSTLKDSNMAIRRLTYQEVPRSEQPWDGEDRISNLPENVLGHILSRLKTEDAVKTSVLSRRWQNKWTSIYNLIFDDSKRYNMYGRLHKQKGTKKADFIDFVDRVLFLCRNSTVKMFNLSCLDKYDSSRVNTWIKAALSCNVQKLTISYVGDLSFPLWSLNCDSLTNLELKLCTVKLSDNLCYSNLQTLNLIKVEFKNDHSLKPGHLLFSLPVLKVFLSSGSKWWNVKVLNIEAPRLSRFEMTDSVFKYASEGSNFCEIKIRGSRIASFKCTVDMFANFEFSRRSKVVDASLMYKAMRDGDLNQRREIGLRGHTLLRRFFAFVKFLEISTDLVEANLCLCLDIILESAELWISLPLQLIFSSLILTLELKYTLNVEDELQELARAEPQSPLPLFEKVTHLKVCSGRMEIQCNGALIDFMKNCPALKSLTFVGEYSLQTAMHDAIELISGDFLSCLEVAKLEYSYCQPELANNPLVKFLLQHAMVLKELLICSKYEGKHSEKVKNQLLRFRRRSSPVTILSF